MFTTIVVPLDDTPDSLRALKPARAIADATGAELVAATVVTSLGERVLIEQELSARISEYGVSVSKVVAYFNVYTVNDGLSHFLERSDETLVVAATFGHSHTAGIVGSHTEKMVHEWPDLAVVLVGPRVDIDNYSLDGPIMACVDSTSESEAVADPVARLAQELLLDPWVVTVMEPATVGASLRPVAGGIEPIFESNRVHVIANQIQRQGTSSVNWEVLHSKHPAKSLVAFADSLNASLIAVATRPRGGLSRLAHGSVAMETVNQASCPVLAVHADLKP